MQEDRFTELALKALWCKDEQEKEAILQEVYAIEMKRLQQQGREVTYQDATDMLLDVTISPEESYRKWEEATIQLQEKENLKGGEGMTRDEQSLRQSSLVESEELSTAQMKMAGLILATDEERLRLMQEVDKIPLEKAKELLATFKARGR